MTISGAESAYVRQLVRSASGLVLGEEKDYLLEVRLKPIAVREGFDTVGQFIAQLRGQTPDLRAEVVDALTTKETYFFRGPASFAALRDEVIPAILRSNGGERLSLWSAATATGQEAYSLAMLCLEHFASVPEIRILATDISGPALATARQGSYTGLEVNRGLPAELLVKYFTRQGVRWQIDQRVRSLVTFRELNLCQPLPALPMMDVILLSNVLIYFDTPTKAAVLRNIGATLRPEGALFLGVGETTFGLDPDYEIMRLGRIACYKYRGRQRGKSGEVLERFR